MLREEAISVTGHRCLEGREMLRPPHCLDRRLTDVRKVVSPMRRAGCVSRKHRLLLPLVHISATG
jgi:hypothetical protein